MIEILTPKEGEVAVLLQEKHLAYIKDPKNDPTSKVDWLNLREVQDDLSYPRPVEVRYRPAVDGEVILRHPSGRECVLSAKKGEASIVNLLLGAEYVIRVRVGDEVSAPRTFRTHTQVPRMLYVDGISNVRDFGGFPTEDGKRIRQEMIYRTSEMDSHVEITEAGKETVYELGIRTDLDIRGIKDEPRSPILDASRVQWVNYPLAAYAEIYNARQIELYGKSYLLLTGPTNYPMIVHCWGGIDRTGTWLYILGAMLGVSEDLLGLDYEMSSFSRWSRRSRRSEQFTDFLNGLYQYGDTLQSAATNFMKACGLTDAQLDMIRKILLEDVK